VYFAVEDKEEIFVFVLHNQLILDLLHLALVLPSHYFDQWMLVDLKLLVDQKLLADLVMKY